MIDPSLLLKEGTLDWIEEGPELFVVSATFKALFAERQVSPGSRLLPPGEPYATERDRDRVLALLNRVDAFSYSDENLDDAGGSVTSSLLASGDPADAVYADEWVFLASHSVMFSAVRHPLNALRRAGVVVVEYGRRVLETAVNMVVPKEHQDRYNASALFARGAIKWLVVGGVAFAGGAVGGGAGGLIALPAPLLVSAVDP